VHDLFEHLSIEGFTRAVDEICRVTRRAICAHFFQMEEIPEHRVRAMDDYYWNLLSLRRTRQLFRERGFAGQAIHLDTFLRGQVNCGPTHNPNAYTLFLSSPD
jgi:hypothetical protein